MFLKKIGKKKSALHFKAKDIFISLRPWNIKLARLEIYRLRQFHVTVKTFEMSGNKLTRTSEKTLDWVSNLVYKLTRSKKMLFSVNKEIEKHLTPSISTCI